MGATGAMAAGPGAVVVTGAAGFFEGKRDTIMALTPFAALFLFFVTHLWLWSCWSPSWGSCFMALAERRIRVSGGVDPD